MRVILAALLAMVAARSGIAQTVPAHDTAAARGACADSVSASYARCALWFNGRSLRRGTGENVIARAGLFRPMPLARHLIGDSARWYGQSYERNVRRANVLNFAGAAISLAGIVVLNSYRCEPDPTLGYCTRRDDAYGFAAAGLFGIGTLVQLGSVPFTLRAGRAASRALWWHNANYGR